MGIFGDSDEETKMVDSNGQVNNNIIIQEAADIHDQTRNSERVLSVMYIMVVLEAIKICIYIYNSFVRRMKKKYRNNAQA